MWHRLVGTTCSPSHILQQQTKKKSVYYMTIKHRIDSNRRSIPVFVEVRFNDTFGPKSLPKSDFSGCNGLSAITWELSETQIRQFCLLTYPSSVKCDSLVKKILLEKLLSTACCSSTRSTYLRHWEWSAGFSCWMCWTLCGCRYRPECKMRHNVP